MALKKGILWGLHSIAPQSYKNRVSSLYNNLTVTPERLEELIIQAREKGYRFVSLDQFLIDKADNQEHKNIVITIDDGWKNVYEYAFPVFQKLNVPFVFYIATGLIENGFKNCPLPELDGMSILCDMVEKEPVADDIKRDLFKKYWKKFKHKKRFLFWKNGYQIMQSLFPKTILDFDKYKRENICTPAELKQMADSGLCELGSHTDNHIHVDRLSPKQTKRECLNSIRKLEQWSGKKCRHFSFPYGHESPVATKIISQYFSSAAVIYVNMDRTNPRQYTLSSDGNYEIPRKFIFPETQLDELLF